MVDYFLSFTSEFFELIGIRFVKKVDFLVRIDIVENSFILVPLFFGLCDI